MLLFLITEINYIRYITEAPEEFLMLSSLSCQRSSQIQDCQNSKVVNTSDRLQYVR